MEAVTAALAAQQAELSGLLRELDEPEWDRESRCPGWTVADVVLHLAQTDELAIGSLAGRFDETVRELTDGIGPAQGVDDGAELMVARERGRGGSAIRARWQDGADDLVRLFRAYDPHRRVAWIAGELSARTLATTRLAETWIHSGDVAAAFDRVLPPTDRLRYIARLAWRTLPYAFSLAGRRLHGPVAFVLTGPDGQAWDFGTDAPPLTTIRGDALELCLVAARRAAPGDTALEAEGKDAEAVLELIRTYA